MMDDSDRESFLSVIDVPHWPKQCGNSPSKNNSELYITLFTATKLLYW